MRLLLLLLPLGSPVRYNVEGGVVSGTPEHKVQGAFRSGLSGRASEELTRRKTPRFLPDVVPLDRASCPSLDIHRAGITFRRGRGYTMGFPRR